MGRIELDKEDIEKLTDAMIMDVAGISRKYSKVLPPKEMISCLSSCIHGVIQASIIEELATEQQITETAASLINNGCPPEKLDRYLMQQLGITQEKADATFDRLFGDMKVEGLSLTKNKPYVTH